MFAGDGGNGNTSITGVNNVWPHKSDLRYYFTDANGESGYVSNDQLRNHEGQAMYWTNATRKQMTTTNTGLPVYVRVGPYNVNPESAVEQMSVIAHEYGHSLGLPDFYSTGTRETMGTWELMAADHAQFMTVFSRQDLGWIVPVDITDGTYTLRESKKDTGSITWKRPDGTPYTLTGEGIHNADALRVQLPKVKLIDNVPSGARAWHSGAGNDFGCPGHTLDVYLPELQQTQNANATAITLKFKSLYEIEWDWDYAFVLASIDGGHTWKALPSKNGTTLSNWNPNNAACYSEYQNGITGVSGDPNTLTNTDRHLGTYGTPEWVDDEFDLTEFRGQNLLLRFAYSTDPAAAKRGWFIDDISVTADNRDIYRSDFESSDEGTRLFTNGFSRVSSADGLDLDHAYYVELRDRVSWDKDGKLQSDRGAPTWAPGIAILYTDENHGYGNTSADGVPAQTVVDSQPEPGNETPNLDDAAFTLTAGDTEFNGCTHIDNYVPSEGGTWKLPNDLKLTVTSLSGLSADGVTSNATATIVADIQPDCSVINEAPVLTLAPGQSDPDTDGSIALTWTRPTGATGPDQIQEATLLVNLVNDDAEDGIGQWTTTASTGTFAWETSQLKTSSGSYAFWGRAAEGAVNVSTALTYSQPITIPSVGTATLTFNDWHMNEGDDSVAVEVSEDGRVWSPIWESTRSELAPDAALAFATEGMTPETVSLGAFRGKTIHLRFRVIAGGENRAGSTPMGWYVDDIRIEAANWYDVGTSNTPSFTRNGVSTNKYYYRVRTTFGSGPIGVPSPWSNIVGVQVYFTPPSPQADLGVSSITLTNNRTEIGEPVTITAIIRNTGNATAAASKTMFTIDDTNVLGAVDTPAIAPGGSIEVTMQWDTTGVSGAHKITVFADDEAVVPESNESNNDVSITVTVSNGRV